MAPQNIANELTKIPAGFLQLDLFNQIARLGVLAYIELVALREFNGKVEVLLTKRSASDPFWPGLYHNPGTVLRPNDTSHTFESALNRLYTDEYAHTSPASGPYFSCIWFGGLERGKGLGLVTWMELDSCPGGEYFAVDNLPPNIISGQAEYIAKCAEDFILYKSGTSQPQLLEDLLITF